MTAGALGIDYASIDGNRFDYAAMTRAAAFAYARSVFTWRGIAMVDPTHAELREHAPPGFPVGGYLILGWHGPGPEEQAERFIAAHGDRKPGELPPALDLEADNAAALGRTTVDCLDWAHRAYDVLVKRYGVVVVYTSARVWLEVFGGAASRMGHSPLWCKIPYPYATGQPAHPDVCPPMRDEWIPAPWRAHDSPGARIEQFQGDARGFPGCSSTVDLNRLVPMGYGAHGNGVAWAQTELGVDADGSFGDRTESALQRWQVSNHLTDSCELDLPTFVWMTA